MGLSPLRDLLSSSTLNRPGVRRSIRASLIVEAANRIIPGHLQGIQTFDIVAISFKDGILKLHVKSAAAKFAFKRVEGEVLKRLQMDFPAASITKIISVLSKEPSRYELS